MECVKLRSAIIQKTLEAVKEFSPNIKTEEGLLDRNHLAKYPLPSIRSIPFYPIHRILKPLLGGNTSTFDKSNEHMLRLEDLLFWDPYMNRGQLHSILTDPDKQDCLVTDDLIFKMSQWFANPQDWEWLAFIFQLEATTIRNIRDDAHDRPDFICRYILQLYTQRNYNPTYKHLRLILEEYSLVKGRNLSVRH